MKNTQLLFVAILALSASSLNAMSASRRAAEALRRVSVTQLEDMSKAELVQAVQQLRNALTFTERESDATVREFSRQTKEELAETNKRVGALMINEIDEKLRKINADLARTKRKWSVGSLHRSAIDKAIDDQEVYKRYLEDRRADILRTYAQD